MPKTIKLSTTYDHAIDVVWNAISDPEAMNIWLMPNDFKPVLGHEFEFRTKPAPGFDGVTRCKVVTLDAPKHLAYTWSGGGLKDTLVTFKLEEEGPNKTRLDFEHSGFQGFVNSVIVRRILAQGWKKKILTIQLPNFLSA